MFPKKINKLLKPKLPRKRKKAMIKAQGRKSYRHTVMLAHVTGESPCKFWDNSSVTLECQMINTGKGMQPVAVPAPKRYW